MQVIFEREATLGSRPASAMEGPPRGEVPGLTGLRFVAAFSVLLAHSLAVLMQDHEVPWGAIHWLKQASGFGMTLFFVLSGFVIHYNYAVLVTDGGSRGITTFLWARFARLYPLFLLLLLVSVLFSIRPRHMWAGDLLAFYDTLRALPYFLLFVQSWFYVPIGDSSLIYAIGTTAPLGSTTSLTWSISTEWFFYLVYPGIAWVVLRSRVPGWTAVAILLWGALWVTVASTIFDQSDPINAWAVARYGSVADVNDPQNAFVRWLLYFSPYLRIGEFILGCLFAHLFVQLRARKITGRENLLGTAAFVAATASVPLITYLEYSPDVAANIFQKLTSNFAHAPGAAILIFCAARYRNVFSRLLMSRPAIVLGDASYSIYLVHFFVLILVRGALLTAARWTESSSEHGVGFDLAAVVVAMAAILLISILLYRCYEAPARRWLRQLWTAPSFVDTRA
jgi:peptidoglycan/LPS O-acetylase OafA/YrhL